MPLAAGRRRRWRFNNSRSAGPCRAERAAEKVPDSGFDDQLAQLSREELDARSIAELDAGRLPLRAQQRLATMRADAAFTSALSVDEHHAIRSVGFSPVGQGMGTCVVHPGA